MPTCDLSIIIIHYKTLSTTLACLASIRQSDDTFKKEILVVDNASKDNSINQIKKKYPEITPIINKTNLGFGVANNLAAKQARGEYLLFLNSDTLVKKDSLRLLVQQAKTRDANVASCKLLNPDGTLQPQGGALPTITSFLVWATGIDDVPFAHLLATSYQHRNPKYFSHDHRVGWVGGTAFLIRKDVFLKVGGFDPNIFMYGEDVELCYRLCEAGYTIDYFSSPEVVHIGQASSSSKASLMGEFMGLKYLIVKHFTGFNKTLSLQVLRLAALLRIIIFGIVGNKERQKIYAEIFTLV